MQFSADLLDEIRARLPVSDVVSRHVRLKKAGREFTGLSPFKQEKTPSFTVNDQKGFYHCFASGEHGDIFTFLMKTEGISFPESVEKLAAEAGVELPKASPQMQQKVAQSQRLVELTEASTLFFEQHLTNQGGRVGLDYLRGRGLDESTIKRFRLGYAPGGRDHLKRHLLQLGFTLEEIVTSGMCIGGRDIAVPYDRFRDRVMFPIKDLKGRIIAFGGRALNKTQKAKYLNSPETPLFHKGRLLYNVSDARQSAHDRGTVIAVEGYMDVIACARAGFDHTLAPLGTALTGDQLKLMWRLASEPVLCFDGDEAGRKAAFRAIDTALPLLSPGYSLCFAFLPDGQDPDDLLKAQGAEAFQAILQKASPLVEVLWQREMGLSPTNTPERRAALEARLHREIGKIAHDGVRSHYEKDVRSRFWELWRGGRKPGQKGYRQHHGAGRGAFAPSGRTGGGFKGFEPDPQPASDRLRQSAMVRGAGTGARPREALLLNAVLHHPWLLDDYSEEIAELDFTDREFVKLRDALLQVSISHSGQNALDTKGLRVHLIASGFGGTLERAGAARIGIDKWVRQTDLSVSGIETSWRQMLGIYQRQQALRTQLQQAEQAFLKEGSEENFDKVRDLNARLLENENLSAGAGGVEGEEDLDKFFAAKLAGHGLK